MSFRVTIEELRIYCAKYETLTWCKNNGGKMVRVKCVFSLHNLLMHTPHSSQFAARLSSLRHLHHQQTDTQISLIFSLPSKIREMESGTHPNIHPIAILFQFVRRKATSVRHQRSANGWPLLKDASSIIGTMMSDFFPP